MSFVNHRLNKDFLEWNRFVDERISFLKDLYIYYLKRNPDLAQSVRVLATDLKQWGTIGHTNTKKDCAVKNTIKWGRKGV